MKLYSNLYQVNPICRYSYGYFSFFFSELWPFYCFGVSSLLILCNFHSFTPHNSVTFLDIVMKFNRIMYQVKMIFCAQASFFPLLLDFKLWPFWFFSFPKSSCKPHNLVTVWDILMKRYSLYAYFCLYTYLVEFSFLQTHSEFIQDEKLLDRSCLQ